jgi:hypothetical protein
MVALPDNAGMSSDAYNSLLNEIKKTNLRLDAISRKTLANTSINVGGININGGRIKITSSGGIQLPAGGNITDASGNIIFSADALSGVRLSTPFLTIPWVPMWDGQDGSAFRTGGSTGGYAFQAQHCMSEMTIWRAVIPQIVHPAVFYNMDVGRLTGTTSTPTYRLYVNGNLLDTFSTTANSFYSCPFHSITGITGFGTGNVSASVTVQSNISSADYFNATAWNLVMCGN